MCTIQHSCSKYLEAFHFSFPFQPFFVGLGENGDGNVDASVVRKYIFPHRNGNWMKICNIGVRWIDMYGEKKEMLEGLVSKWGW